LLDLTQPVAAVLCASVLHFVSDAEEPHRVIAGYRDRIASGSYLMISHGATGKAGDDPDDVIGGVTKVYRQASSQLHVRSDQAIERFFEGFEFVDPGLTWLVEWRPNLKEDPHSTMPRSLRAAVARKPLPRLRGDV
jgi:hypothetical protein